MNHRLTQASRATPSDLIRWDRINTLRGLACLLVVAFHAIGAEPTSGMHMANGSWYRFTCNLFMHVRMPLFAFLSGLVYALRPVQAGEAGIFASKKVRRLLVPLIAVTSLFYLLTLVAPYDKSTPPPAQFWRIYVYPFAQYWFLQAMILIFALVALLDDFRMLNKARQYWAFFALATLASVGVNIEPDVFSADHALELLPYFLLGLGLVRFPGWLTGRNASVVCAVLFLALLARYAVVLYVDGGPLIPKRSPLGILMGTTAVVALVHWFPSVRALASIGTYSFAIYLFHSFFTAGTRQLLLMTHFPFANLVVFACCVAAGIAGPIVLERTMRPIPWLSRIFLGQWSSRPSTANAAA